MGQIQCGVLNYITDGSFSVKPKLFSPPKSEKLLFFCTVTKYKTILEWYQLAEVQVGFKNLKSWKIQQEFVNLSRHRSTGLLPLVQHQFCYLSSLPYLLKRGIKLHHFLETFHGKGKSKPAIFLLFTFILSGKSEIHARCSQFRSSVVQHLKALFHASMIFL